MSKEKDESKKAVLWRLKRIEGQIQGIQRMIETDRDCGEVLQQLTAVRAAVHAASVELLEHHALSRMLDGEDAMSSDERQKLYNDFVALLGKTKGI
jgi:CsoR family transcriptional regulator, copper-sensing transcriptional repressor